MIRVTYKITHVLSELHTYVRACMVYVSFVTSDYWLEYRADRTAGLCRRSYAEGGAEMMRRGIKLESLLRCTIICVVCMASYLLVCKLTYMLACS